MSQPSNRKYGRLATSTTRRLSGVTYPTGTGLSTSYAYFDNMGDQRLQEIKNLTGSSVLSKFNYTYNAVGTIATWKQQADSDTPTQYALGYDNADQLTSAVQSNTSTDATVTSNAYNYDPAGNRLAETTLTGATGGQFNNLNQLTATSGSTASQGVAGNTTATASSVTVNSVPATITSGTNFSASVALPPGTNTLSVVARPTAGAPTTKRYQVVTSGTSTQLAYDANGNTLTDESGNSYQWDALNRLTKITYPSGASSLFAYDGLSRRISIIEKDASNTVTSTKNYLWIGSEIAEERDASNAVTKRFFSQGEQQFGTSYYYTRDHLKSVRELVDGSGTMVTRMAYASFGRVTVVTGTNLPTFGFAQLLYYAPSGLYLSSGDKRGSTGRPYDSNIARWPSRDPLGERGGIDLYVYCADDPIDHLDPYGLSALSGIIRRSPLNYGKCCNQSNGVEYAAVAGNPSWAMLLPGQCVGSIWGFFKEGADDCEGMTCGGGFYYVQGGEEGGCKTPGCDHGPYKDRRWTNSADSDPGGQSPAQRGMPQLPPNPLNYPYGPRQPLQ